MSSRIIFNTSDPTDAARGLHGKIAKHLNANESILLLVSGGSAIDVATKARKLLGKLPSGSNLHVAQIDERYGPVGHENSNYKALTDSGFDTNDLTMHAVLEGTNKKRTTRTYEKVLKELVEESDTVIGLFGMGSDGHTAGLLPGNPLMDSEYLVDNYLGPDFDRITITPKFMQYIDVAVLYAIGKNKGAEMRKFLDDEKVTESPVKILNNVDNLIIYTDYQGGSI